MYTFKDINGQAVSIPKTGSMWVSFTDNEDGTHEAEFVSNSGNLQYTVTSKEMRSLRGQAWI